jgi:hypothetical protein
MQGFQEGRSCIDLTEVLRIIIEQSLELNSSAYIAFIDFEKDFDRLDRKVFWKLSSGMDYATGN